MFDTYPASKCTTSDIYTCVYAGLVVIASLRTALGSLKEERRRKNKDEQFAWATISVYHFRNVCQPRYIDIFMLKRIAWTFLDNWNFEKRRDSEDRHHLLESRHLDLRRRTIDFGAFNGLFGSAYAQEKAGTVNSKPIEIRDNKDTRNSSFSAKVAAILNPGHPYMSVT